MFRLLRLFNTYVSYGFFSLLREDDRHGKLLFCSIDRVGRVEERRGDYNWVLFLREESALFGVFCGTFFSMIGDLTTCASCVPAADDVSGAGCNHPSAASADGAALADGRCCRCSCVGAQQSGGSQRAAVTMTTGCSGGDGD